MIASVGSTITGASISSTRTSPGACMTTARMTWLLTIGFLVSLQPDHDLAACGSPGAIVVLRGTPSLPVTDLRSMAWTIERKYANS